MYYKGDAIKIGYSNYNISNEEDYIVSEDMLCYGLINFDEETIQVVKRKNEWAYLEVLLHEIVHGVFYHQGNHDLCGNEEIIESVAQGITTVLKENKDLIKYINKIK